MIHKQLTAIEKAASAAITMLANAADKATSAISSAAIDATKLLASQAQDAAKVANVKTNDDHDTLIEIKTKLEGIKCDIKELKDGTSTQITNHDTRIDALEKQMSDFITVKRLVYGCAGLILTAVIVAIIYLVIK